MSPTAGVASSPNWVLDEDQALKTKLSGFTVTNYADGATIPVAVYFRFPDAEEVTRTYPHIAIDLVTINFAAERAHRNYEYILPYSLEQATPPSGSFLVGDDFPLPWDLVYQLAVYSRNPVHDRQLLLMMYQMFPEEYGSLDMSSIDGTVRRADFVSVVRRDTVDRDNKRLYRNIYTISISSEFFLNQIRTVQKALSLDVITIPSVGQPLVAP